MTDALKTSLLRFIFLLLSTFLSANGYPIWHSRELVCIEGHSTLDLRQINVTNDPRWCDSVGHSLHLWGLLSPLWTHSNNTCLRHNSNLFYVVERLLGSHLHRSYSVWKQIIRYLWSNQLYSPWYPYQAEGIQHSCSHRPISCLLRASFVPRRTTVTSASDLPLARSHHSSWTPPDNCGISIKNSGSRVVSER